MSEELQGGGVESAPQQGEAFEIIKIFISHKSEDKAVANRLKDLIDTMGNDKAEAFCSDEDIVAGDEWNKKIENEIAPAHILILIYTDPGHQWDWCLYEAGLYTDVKNPNAVNRVICLHRPNLMPPDPLRKYQSVKAEAPEVENFLKKLFGTTELTGTANVINKKYVENNESIAADAESICKLIGTGKNEKENLTEWMSIQIQKNDIQEILHSPEKSPANAIIPGNAKIVSNEKTLRMFELRLPSQEKENWTWEKIKEKAGRDEDQAWISELEQLIFDVWKDEIGMPVQSNFTSMYSSKRHRPVVSSCETDAEGNKAFKVLFVVNKEETGAEAS